MSKAEERAFERCPKSENAIDELRNERKRAIFTEGYHQAEKDLELTWEDIKVIEKLLGFDNIIESPKEFYQEVLKRFKDFKERKEK